MSTYPTTVGNLIGLLMAMVVGLGKGDRFPFLLKTKTFSLTMQFFAVLALALLGQSFAWTVGPSAQRSGEK